MEAGTQSALLLIWALFWMLVLSLMMVHPMFRMTRVQIRRSLRLNLNRWSVTRQRMRGRMLLYRGRFRIRLGKSMLWLARYLKKETSPPFWIRFPAHLLGRLVWFYLFMHLLLRQSMTWQNVLGCLALWEVMDVVERWWKRRKQRLQEINAGGASPVKPAQEQRAKP
ncbi:MAG: hypothetical protein JWL77_6018 [Chthonomonadaceae bacterium]|nr:hypothetical protein [Chthonomonadaceae bacterium]